MSFLKKMPLILIEANEISFQGREGKEVRKWKYTFLDSKEQLVIGYDDLGDYQDLVQNVSRYTPEKATEFSFALREFQGVTRLHLLSVLEIKKITADLEKVQFEKMSKKK